MFGASHCGLRRKKTTKEAEDKLFVNVKLLPILRMKPLEKPFQTAFSDSINACAANTVDIISLPK
jgi:hypothetical protein